ncbi:MAG: gliding motility-associated C-terminal domain-containing protein, partial [Balneolaceae bacterium]
KQIPPGGHALLYADNSNEQFTKSGNARFFGLNEEFTPFAIRFDRATLSLPLSGRPVFLADSTGSIIDYVDYTGDWHNPNIPDTKGISLERINPDLQSNDPANWSSSASPLGGTPLQRNSLFQTPELATAGIGLTLEPNPFSPDGDGRNDNLFIRYQLDEPDYMMRIRIYDRYGRLIRKLADSQIAGFEGTVLWDGLRDNGQRNRIGIYIVLFEAFNSSNGSNRTFKETIVIARNLK